ncbi:alpha-ketoglutarate-dependent dioxygenase AlkB [Shewanella olleyana]|uniref:alpha-ketoglutarate-dependent dioxygenase AlkB family protein n=1 Tax=Shewanella olleyana TaxID=135626 RepID=UPI002010830B|nr:alpha-ketoglutarate-dependent dioxygenase AlkB [Shewanella olleyana]MCL1066655.1 alpha-ketoglutarate-dependent dioxygenase AlkB [Shewanella olleyana]
MRQLGLGLLSDKEDKNLSPKHEELTAPVTFIKGFIGIEQQQALLKESLNYPFEQPEITVFGKQHPIPRSQVWFADKGCAYRYSSLLVTPTPWPEGLAVLRRQLLDQFGIDTNGVLVNRYQNGLDSMGWHSDDEAEIEPNTDIVSISLGATRTFVLRHKLTKKKQSFELASGDLLIMHGGMQQNWQHSVPRRMKVSQPRLNYTFRKLIKGFHD